MCRICIMLCRFYRGQPKWDDYVSSDGQIYVPVFICHKWVYRPDFECSGYAAITIQELLFNQLKM
jgi:hypothetical protein